ncbi:hypothetical protein [Streptomyces sp. NPDC052496]|uniref:hypothetical protein n=1 Tax=Streptomyces sp. NPDC052496 TaxID=3154951 RepID=UPI00341D609C
MSVIAIRRAASGAVRGSARLGALTLLMPGLLLAASPASAAQPAGERVLPHNVCVANDPTVEYRRYSNIRLTAQPNSPEVMLYLRCGNDNYGLRHIEAGHGPFNTVPAVRAVADCVGYILRDPDTRRNQGGGAYRFTRKALDGVVWRVGFRTNGTPPYNVVTAFAEGPGNGHRNFSRCR